MKNLFKNKNLLRVLFLAAFFAAVTFTCSESAYASSSETKTDDSAVCVSIGKTYTYYTSLNEIPEEYKYDTYIVLLKDATLTERLYLWGAGSVTFNLNGHTISYDNSSGDNMALDLRVNTFYIYGNSSGQGGVSITGNSKNLYAVFIEKGEVTFQSGYYTATNPGGNASAVWWGGMIGGSLEVKSGEYTADALGVAYALGAGPDTVIKGGDYEATGKIAAGLATLNYEVNVNGGVFLGKGNSVEGSAGYGAVINKNGGNLVLSNAKFLGDEYGLCNKVHSGLSWADMLTDGHAYFLWDEDDSITQMDNETLGNGDTLGGVIEVASCEHGKKGFGLAAKTTVVNKKAATYYATGYTGDTKCLLCNTICKKGSTIAKKTLATPKLTMSSKTKRTLIASVAKVTNATKYQFRYRRYGKTTWTTKTVTANKSGATKLTVKSLTSGKKYQVKARAVVSNGTKTAYSSWCSIKTVKVK